MAQTKAEQARNQMMKPEGLNMETCSQICENCRQCDIRARLKPELVFRPVPNTKPGDNLLFAEGCAIATANALLGNVLSTCSQLGHPMVFLQKKHDTCKTRSPNASEDDFAQQFDRLETTVFYDRGVSVCQCLREGDGWKYCHALDAFMADALLRNKDDPSKIKENSLVFHGKSIKFRCEPHDIVYKGRTLPIRRLFYQCPRSGHCEIAHLININGIYCVLILGQLLAPDLEEIPQDAALVERNLWEHFMPKRNDEFDLSKNASEVDKARREAYVKRIKSEVYITDVKMIDDDGNLESLSFMEALDAYFAKLYDSLQAMYWARFEKVKMKIISQAITDYIGKVDSIYPIIKKELAHMEESEFQSELYKKAADLFKVMLERCIPTTSEDDHPTITEFLGIEINKDDITIKFEGKDSKVGFEPATVPLSILEKLERGKAFHEAAGAQAEYFEFHKSITGTQMPVVRVDNIKPAFEYISQFEKESFQDIFSQIYDQFALVCTCLNYRFYAEYLRSFVASMRHELAQVHKGHLDMQSMSTNRLNDLTNERRDLQTTLPRPDVDELLKYYHQYLHASMLRVNSTRYLTIIPEPSKGTFFPYDRFLYKWSATYQLNSVFNKYNQLDTVTHVSLKDTDFPEMYSDSDLMEQVAYNLTENAFKYARKGTRIVLDCRVTSDKQWYELTVVNYGYAILEEEFKKLKSFGFRASASNSSDIQGSGMGLWYCERVLQRLGGELNIRREEVCDFDIEGLMLYCQLGEADQVKVQTFLRMKEREFDAEKFHDDVKSSMRKLEESEYRTDFIPELLPQKLDNPFTPMSVALTIKKKTWKYTFIARIPNK